MSGLPWPGFTEDDARSWDAVLLGGHLLPGYCKLSVDGEMDIDEGKAGDTHGANIKFKGFKPRQVTIEWSILDHGKSDDGTLEALTQADWDLMQDILDEWEPITGKKDTSPLQIINNKTAARNVFSIALKKISGPDYADGQMTVKITAVEWNKPATTGVKGTGTAKSEKATAPGSEWEQAPNAKGEIETTATKSAPHNKETGP